MNESAFAETKRLVGPLKFKIELERSAIFGLDVTDHAYLVNCAFDSRIYQAHSAFHLLPAGSLRERDEVGRTFDRALRTGSMLA